MSMQFFTVVVLLSRCVPFHCRQARVAKRHARLGPFPGSAVPGQVVLARRCATPSAVCVRAVRSVARGDTIGAVLGRSLGHYDRCRGLDHSVSQLLRYVCFHLFSRLLMKPVALPQVLFLFLVFLPVVIVSGTFVQTAEKTVEFPQFPFFDKVVHFSCCGAEADCGPTVCRTTVFPLLLVT